MGWWTFELLCGTIGLVVKEPGKQIPRRSLEDTWMLAIGAIEKGMHSDNAAYFFGRVRSTVYGWLKARRTQGLEALTIKGLPGPAPKLTERQTA